MNSGARRDNGEAVLSPALALITTRALVKRQKLVIKNCVTTHHHCTQSSLWQCKGANASFHLWSCSLGSQENPMCMCPDFSSLEQTAGDCRV